MKACYGMLLFVIACTGSAGPTGPQGPEGPQGSGGGAMVSVNGITPRHGFLGRTVEVEISGDNTSFDSSTTVDFGAGITVVTTTVVSPTLLVLTLSITPGAAVGDRDIRINTSSGTLVATGGFSVDPSLAVTVSGAALQQGDITELTAYSLDPDVPLAQDSYPDTSGVHTSIVAQWDPTTQSATYLTFVDVSAPPGPTQLSAAGVSTTPHLLYSDPAALVVGARTPTALTVPSTTSVVFDTRSKVFTAQTTSLGILSVTPSSVGTSVSSLGYLSTGSPEYEVDFGGLLGGNRGMARAVRGTTTTNIVVGGNQTGTDAAHTESLSVALTAVGAITADSATAHDLGSPQTVTSPAIIDGMVTGSEQDAYSISVADGASVEVTIWIDGTGADFSLTGPSGSLLDFPGLTGGFSYRVTNSSGSAANVVLALTATGSTATYTTSFRLY